MIPAALITAINSDLPGEVIAQVTEPVYDHATGRTVLIPQGSRLIGQYDSQVAYGQERALIAWNRVIMPNGRSINIGSMTGADLTGASGLHDRDRRSLRSARQGNPALDHLQRRRRAPPRTPVRAAPGAWSSTAPAAASRTNPSRSARGSPSAT